MSDIDTERVILEVQCRPALWDLSNNLYKDRDARQAAWLEICKELYENYEDFSDTEKKSTEKKIQARWKTARDCYTKVKASNKKLKSGSGAKKGKGYSYYNIMTFLDSNKRVEGQESLENSQDDSSGHTSTLELSQHPIVDTSEVLIPETSTSGNENDTASRETQKQSKRKKASSPTPFEIQLLQSIQHKKDEENDEDLSFFKSIMPNIKKLSTYQKLLFRSKVLNLLIDIERENVITLEDLSNIVVTNDTQAEH